MDSEINCLCNVLLGRKIWLTLGSKRKSVDPIEINIGDWVNVSNHGNLFLWAQVKEIDFSKNLAKVKWEISCTTDVVEIANLHPYSTSVTSKWKRIETDFFHHHNNQMCKITANDEKLCDKQTVSECLVPIQYYSLENTSKFCTEGSVKNLLNMLRFSEHDVSMYWDLATAPLHSICKRLCKEVPKIVCNHFSQVNSIQKCLWILRKQFKFISTKKLNCHTWCGSRVVGTKTYIFNPSLRLVLYQFLHMVSLCHHKTIHYTQQTATNTATMVAKPLTPPATRIWSIHTIQRMSDLAEGLGEGTGWWNIVVTLKLK